jgi:hypothetical protein
MIPNHTDIVVSDEIAGSSRERDTYGQVKVLRASMKDGEGGEECVQRSSYFYVRKSMIIKVLMVSSTSNKSSMVTVETHIIPLPVKLPLVIYDAELQRPT